MKKVIISMFLALVMLLSLGFGSLMPSAMAEAGASKEAKAALDEGVAAWFGTGKNGYDRDKALEAFRRAAAAGSADAYYWLAEICLAGTDPRRGETAAKYLETGAAQGSALCLCGQGELYRLGLGVAKDTAKAKELYQQAIDAGCLLGWRGMGLTKLKGAKAAECYEKMLGSKDWYTLNLGRCALGDLYAAGAKGLDADGKKAKEYYQKAADDGFADGWRGLGELYYGGNGMKQNADKALESFSAAEKGGFGCGLGLLYENGVGVKQDGKRAAELFRRDIESGKSALSSLYGMARLAAKGLGVKQDKDAAIRWCRKGIAAATADDEAVAGELRALLQEQGGKLKAAPKTAGEYSLGAVEEQGMRLSADEFGVSGSMTLAKDGTGALSVAGNEGAIEKWEEKDGLVSITVEGDTVECPLSGGVLSMEVQPGVVLLFVHRNAGADLSLRSLTAAFCSSIDPKAGAHLGYEFHPDYMVSTSIFDVHTRGESYYSERVTRAGKAEQLSATCFLDGKVYNLYPKEKKAILVTTTSSSIVTDNVLRLDTLYKALYSNGHTVAYSLEIRELDGNVYTVEIFPGNEYTGERAYYYDAEGALIHIHEAASDYAPQLGETFYTVHVVDTAVNDALFDISGYTIEK